MVWEAFWLGGWFGGSVVGWSVRGAWVYVAPCFGCVCADMVFVLFFLVGWFVIACLLAGWLACLSVPLLHPCCLHIGFVVGRRLTETGLTPSVKLVYYGQNRRAGYWQPQSLDVSNQCTGWNQYTGRRAGALRKHSNIRMFYVSP